MSWITYQGGNIITGGQRASKDIENMVLALSAISGKGINETCDILNHLLQTFKDTWEALKNILDEIEVEVIKDICESCISRRTRHDNKEPGKGKYITKWSEKYRPP